jgi:alpha-1,6-mannosyltransferase
VALTPFVRSRFAIVWSATIFISYFTYSNSGFTENLWLVAFEYLAVIAFLFWEWRTDRI